MHTDDTHPILSKRLGSHAGLLLAALLALGSPLLVWGAFFTPYLDYDDKVMIEENPLAQEGLTLHAIEKVGRPPLGDHRGFYRQYIPLTYLTLGGQWALHGPQMWAFRLVNLLFHWGSALFLYAILRRLIPRDSLAPAALAALGAALFFFHPTNVESVAWASERNNVQSLFFCLLAWWLIVKGSPDGAEATRLAPPTLRCFTLAVAAYFCALLSKPMAIGFAPLFVLVECLWIKGPRLGRLLRGTAFVLLGAAASYVALYAGRGDLLPLTGGSHAAWALTSFSLLGRGLSHILFPWPLSFFYGVETVSELFDPWVGFTAAFLGALLMLSLWLPVPRRILAVLWPAAILAFCTKLTPRTNAYLFQDRYLYFSLPLAAILLVLAFEAWQHRLRLLGPVLGTAAAKGAFSAAVLACAACGVLSLRRSFDFADSERLFRDAVQKQPQSYFAHYNLAQKLLVRSVTEPPSEKDPWALLREAREHVVAMNAAVDRERQKDLLHPRLVEAEIDFRLYRPEARELLEWVVRNASTGQVFFRTKARWFLAEMAKREYLKTRRREPLEERLERVQQALEENPENAQLLVAQAETLELLGRAAEAAASYGEALRNTARSAEARAALERLGLPEESTREP